MRKLLLTLLLLGCPAHTGQGTSPTSTAEAPMPESSTIGLGFLLTRSTTLDVGALLAASKELGLPLTPSEESEEEVVSFEVQGGGILVVLGVPMRHPDAPTMLRTPFSPDDQAIERAEAHFIVTAMQLPGDQAARDSAMARLVAAVDRATECEGAMLGHGMVFYKPAFFVDMAQRADSGMIPVEVAVDLTMGREEDGRFGVLTHGLVRYEREEFFITTGGDPMEAISYAWMMSQWMVNDRSVSLPTGDTVGRTAEEKILVQRVPSPAEDGTEVIRLDLD